MTGTFIFNTENDKGGNNHSQTPSNHSIKSYNSEGFMKKSFLSRHTKKLIYKRELHTDNGQKYPPEDHTQEVTRKQYTQNGLYWRFKTGDYL